MRLLAFSDDGAVGLAVETDTGRFRGLTTLDAAYPGALETILARDALDDAAAALAKGRPIDPAAVAFRTPLAGTGRIVCVGLNYRAHAEETGHAIPTYPTLFARFAAGLVPHGAPLIRPRVSHELDYEGELAVVIGKAARHVAVADALEHVAGYSVFNDGSVRDFQMRTPQWTMGKNFDGTGGFGPCFVSADALPPGAAGLRLQTRVNGTVVQDTLTSDMIFDVATLVSLLSEGFTLHPGDLIMTGTPSGVGGLRKPQLFLKAGDICEVEIEGIGVLSNPVIDEET